MAKTLKDVINDIDEVKKSMAEKPVEKSADEAEKTAHKDESDLKDQEEATKSQEAEKNVKELKVSDDNEKAVKKIEKDDDEDSDDDVQESATKSKKKEECGGSVDESVKSTDGKVEEARAKQAKELSGVEDPKGHEEASKSIDAQAALDALSKAVDTMAEMQKSYIKQSESLMEITKKSVAQPEIEKSVESDTEKSSKCDTEKTDKACDTEKTDKACGGKKSEKSAKEEKCDVDDANDEDDEKSAKKSVEPAEDNIEKSIPEGKAVANPEAVEDEADTTEKSLKMGEFKDVILKSISNVQGVEDQFGLNTEKSLKSLYGKVRDIDDDKAVSDDLVEEYNRI